MSPTDAILTRRAERSGSGGSGGGGGGSTVSAITGSGGGSGTGSGVVVHAASSSSAVKEKSDRSLVTETDAEDVDLRDTQATAQHIEFVEIVRGPDIHAVVISVVDLDALDV